MVRLFAGARPIAVWSAVLCLVLSGCASLPEDVDRDISTAIGDYDSTKLGQLFAADEKQHPGLSGFAVVSDSVNAFRARIAMIRLAERNIDVQYYIWEADTTGGLMALELLDAANRGVRVRVLTNSLASNDVAAAHAGYENFREDLLKAGVELYELRPDSDEIIRAWSVVAGDSRSLLHTKALVWDRDTLFIGSLNLDPRSTDINTEMGLLVESEELAQKVAAYMDQGASLNNAYRVQLDAKGDLVWTTRMDNGELVQLDEEPQTGVLKRGTADFIKMLPVESQL